MFWSRHVGAAAGCCSGAGVRFGGGLAVPLCCRVLQAVACALSSWPAGAGAGCCLRVVLLEWCVRYQTGQLPLQEATVAAIASSRKFRKR